MFFYAIIAVMTQDTAFRDLLECIETLSLNDKEAFFESLLTEQEKNDIAVRWAILNDLKRAIPQRTIVKEYSTSLQKVSKCRALLKDNSDIISAFLQHRYDETVR